MKKLILVPVLFCLNAYAAEKVTLECTGLNDTYNKSMSLKIIDVDGTMLLEVKTKTPSGTKKTLEIIESKGSGSAVGSAYTWHTKTYYFGVNFTSAPSPNGMRRGYLGRKDGSSGASFQCRRPFN
jgi:hypothetical protein